MPLTHVCVWDHRFGYRRITVEEASERYPYTISVKQGFFRCELCAQKIGFTKARVDTGNRHFYHSSGEQDKRCEDRQQLYDRPLLSLNSHTMPIRIEVSERTDTFQIQIGFFLPSGDRRSNFCCNEIRIGGNPQNRKIYKLYDFDGIAAKGITYLNVDEISQEYWAEYIQSSSELKRFWPAIIAGVNPNGTFFDKQSRKMIPPGGKAYTHREYYLLQRKPLCPNSDIIAEEIMSCRKNTQETWYLYEIKSQYFCKRAAEFFLERSVFLSENPVKFYPIWPAYIADPYFIYHEQFDVFFYLCGDSAELKLYPVTLTPKSQDAEKGKLVKIYTQSREQLVSLGTSGALGFSYLSMRKLDMEEAIPHVKILDSNRILLDKELYTKLPPKKRITISELPFDGKVVLCRKGIVQTIYQISAGQTLTVDSITFDTEVCVYQGCDCVRTICFKRKQDTNNTQIRDKKLAAELSACHGNIIAAPHSLGAIARKFKDYPRTRQWIYTAIRRGNLPRTAYRLLVKASDRRI